MITYKLHLIRTGSTSGEPGKRYVGQADPPLCEKGLQELQELKEQFQYPKVEMLYTSPLDRCLQTAEILYPDTYVVKKTGLMDMNLGVFENKSFEELRDNAAFTAWLKNSFENTPPGGEDTTAFTNRIVGAVSDIFATMMADKVTNVAVVTHAGVIMTLLGAIGIPKLPIHQWMVGNGTGYTLLMTPQMWMRDRSAEIFSHIPVSKIEDDMDVYGLYFNE